MKAVASKSKRDSTFTKSSLLSTIILATIILQACHSVSSYSQSSQLTSPAFIIPTSPTGGLLPYWMLLISSAAFYNVAQSYIVLWQTKEIYGRRPEQG
jgi:hypothetical protein